MASVTIAANYPSTCTNAVSCNQPLTTTDAAGKVTNYTYDGTSGLITSVTLPADAAGVRPQTRYSYTSYQAYYKNSAGSIVASGVPVTELTGVSTCLSATSANPASCVGSASERKASVSYGPQSAGTANNLLPVSTTQAAGDGSLSATSAMTYDSVGNLASVDGPLPGSGDTTVYHYDADRRLVGIVGPDPDGTGPRTPAARKITYNANGQVATDGVGTVTDQSNTAWANYAEGYHQYWHYDANGRADRTTVWSSGTDYAVEDYLYDTMGRLRCSVQYMNPAVWGPQATSCTPLQTTGPNGPDRVTQMGYDAVGRVLTVTEGVGTSAAAVSRTNTWTTDGLLATVKDGENNLTSYTYDGLDRLVKTNYPNTTKGAGTSNGSDYEQLTYGDNVHVTQVRMRDGNTMAFTYDGLGRTLTRTPGGGTSVNFTYDLLGDPTLINEGPLNLTSSFDALGRVTQVIQPFGSVSYQYDAAGNRTRETWGDGMYVTYDHDNTGAVTAIRENGAASGVGVLASYAYDNLGRASAVTYGNGTSRSFAYDAVSRMTGLKLDLAGTANDLIVGAVGGSGTAIAYNPASQIASLARSNDAYAWTGAVNVNRGYTSNGLNQYTVSGSTSLGYDTRGNLTTSGSSTYSYDLYNRMTAVSGAATIGYDPLGRIAEYDTSVSTRFYYDGAHIAAEVNNPGGAILRRYVYGPGADTPIVWYEGSGTSDRRFLQGDERGSIVAVTDSSGNLLAKNTYDEFGIPGGSWSLTTNGRFAYTGQAYFPEMGLFWYKARMYSPTLGRFMQTDPIGYGDGLNWYDYTHGDPVNGTDPSGQLIEVIAPATGGPTNPVGAIATVAAGIVDLAGAILGLFGGGAAVTPAAAAPAGGVENGQIVVNGPPPSPLNYDTAALTSPPTLIAAMENQIVVQGRLPQSGTPHRYDIHVVTQCSAASAFDAMRAPGNSAPGAPYAASGTHDLVLTGGNPITQIVNPSNRTITNITKPGHIFYPGSVNISVTDLGGGYSQINITGTGTGNYAWFNDQAGGLIFGGTAYSVADYCAAKSGGSLNGFHP